MVHYSIYVMCKLLYTALYAYVDSTSITVYNICLYVSTKFVTENHSKDNQAIHLGNHSGLMMCGGEWHWWMTIQLFKAYARIQLICRGSGSKVRNRCVLNMEFTMRTLVSGISVTVH